MSKLAFLRGTTFIKGAQSNDVLLGKFHDDSEKGNNLMVDEMFGKVVEMTLRGGEQHSQILGLQAAQGILQRLTNSIKDAPETSPGTTIYYNYCCFCFISVLI